MDKVLLYICYDPFDYINYYSLAINNQRVCDVVPEERIGEMFDMCDELNISKTDTQWCIVQDEDASHWDYENELQERGYSIKPMSISLSILTSEMNTLFDNDFVIAPNQDAEKKCVKILYPHPENDDCVCDRGKALNDAESILNNAGMTELAKIIREKYERMNKHE